jgi:hypothetical protein
LQHSYTATLLAAFAAATSGCRTDCIPLEQISLTGEWSTSHRDIANDLLEDFSSTSVLPICVAELTASPNVNFGGRFNPVTDVIKLNSDQDDATFGRAMTHELCHALDRTNLLVERDPTLWTGEERHGSMNPRKEAFASWCGAVRPSSFPLLYPFECAGDQAADRRDVFLSEEAFGGPRIADDVWWSEPFLVTSDGAVPESIAPKCLDDGSVRLSGQGMGWRLTPNLQLTREDQYDPSELLQDNCKPALDQYYTNGPTGWLCTTGCNLAHLPDGRTVATYLHHEDPFRAAGKYRLLVERDGRFEAVGLCPSEDMEAAMLGGEPILLERNGSSLSVRYLSTSAPR